MTDLLLAEFRLHDLADCGPDGYPHVWHRLDHLADELEALGLPPRSGVKDVVRALAGHRCARCGHPYRVGQTNPEWSACDERCTHAGPVQVRAATALGQRGSFGDFPEGAGALEAARALLATLERTHLRDGRWQGGVYDARVEARWRVLTVHHLRLGQDAKRDLRWWNLAPLCQRCHLAIQGKVLMERVWPWPHSEWFRPYAAGWYAHAYLGEDLTREEVEARLPELLALEQAVSG